jgi:CRP-like cAMP-binding protein
MSDMSPLTQFVRKLNGHVALSDDDRDMLLGLPYSERDVNASALLTREGETSGSCAILARGFACRHKFALNGNRQIVSVQIPGDALDLQHLYLNRADHNVQALTRASLAMVSRGDLRRVAQQSATIAHAFAVSNLVEASISREWVLNVGRRSSRQRLAHLLCELVTRLELHGHAVKDNFELPLTQEQLGDATGMTAVHVNRTLGSMEDDGLIRRTGRFYKFPYWTALKNEAGFDPLYLHLEQQSAAA